MLPSRRHRQRKVTHESTWFSKDRMRGYGEVLKALSAIASITSCSPGKIQKNSADYNLFTFTQERREFKVNTQSQFTFTSRLQSLISFQTFFFILEKKDFCISNCLSQTIYLINLINILAYRQ